MSKLKVLFAPLSLNDIQQTGMSDAWTDNGCEVSVFSYMEMYMQSKNPPKINQDLIEVAKNFKPDIVHLQIQHTTVIEPNSIRIIKQLFPNCIILNVTSDIRTYIPQPYRAMAEVSDYNFISSTGQLDFFRRELGNNVYYWQIGYNNLLYGPENQNNQFEYDSVYIGHYNGREDYPGTVERIKCCELLKNNFGNRFGLFGSGEWPYHLRTRGSVDQRTVSNIYKQSVAAISISHFNNIDHYFSDRLFMCLASGRPTVCYRFPKYESYFTDMCDLVIADSIEDIPNKVRMLKENPDLANYIGKNGAAKVFAEHTYYSRVKELMSMIGVNNG